MKPVVIFGATDLARVVHHYLTVDSPYDVAAFTVHERYIDEPEISRTPVVPFETLTKTHPPEDFAMFVGTGYSRVNQLRAEIYNECKGLGYEFISYVNSKAATWGEVDMGENVFIFEQNVIQPFVKIGNNVILWSGNHIGHDVTIGNHVFIASHAVVSGNATIGDYCFVGVNATFRDGVTVAPRCIIGASATIMRDTEEGDVIAVRHTEAHPKKSWEIDF